MDYLVQSKRERVISNGNETKIKAKITATKSHDQVETLAVQEDQLLSLTLLAGAEPKLRGLTRHLMRGRLRGPEMSPRQNAAVR